MMLGRRSERCCARFIEVFVVSFGALKPCFGALLRSFYGGVCLLFRNAEILFRSVDAVLSSSFGALKPCWSAVAVLVLKYLTLVTKISHVCKQEVSFTTDTPLEPS
jgi:hypothetical protein